MKLVRPLSPEDRNALMAEHMKTMQDGMGMMKGMGGMAGPKGPPNGMAERQTMMEQRMEMMVDRLPQTAAKP